MLFQRPLIPNVLEKIMIQKALFWILILALSFPVLAQNEKPTISADDYARAERFLSASTTPLVTGMVSGSTWLPDGKLLYRKSVLGGSEFIIVDPKKKTIMPAFDHARMAQALAGISDTEYKASELPSRFRVSGDGQSIVFTIGRKQVNCNFQTYECSTVPRSRRNLHISPDRKKGAFIREHNLWIRDLESGGENQLTFDGIEDFGYATNNAGWTKRDTPVLLWSPQSDKIATFQHDGRGVGEMYLVETAVGHGKLEAWKYPLPGDSLIFRLQRVVIHLDGPRVVRLKHPPDPHRSTISDHVAARDGSWLDVEWSTDGKQLAFVKSSRDHKEATLFVANPETGEVRKVMKEVEETFFESGRRKVNWHILPETNEFIWYSQRDNWGHLYLFDLNTGKLKNQITKGDWVVSQLLHIDKKKRLLYFLGGGKETGDPYFQYLYRVRFDGNKFKNLTPEVANHTITLSEDNNYFVDSYSTPTVPPKTIIRNMDGKVRMALVKADISRLVDKGWQPPIPFKTKARDGKTDLYGLMYKPTNFDPSKKYPVLNYIYPGPQSGSVRGRSFLPARSDNQSLAELGFIVVEVDAMGTPGRSKSFHDAYYGNMGDNGLPDQIATIKQLAGKNHWMDISRVGVWGHSGGGFASTDAILRYPDFYKVAVSGAGNHDQRNYEDDWGEKWQGLLVENEDGTTNYDNQANQLLAGNLKGKLLLAHGTMDSNVPPYNTLLVVDALIAANKDFDLIMFPNRGHGFGREKYMMRRRWDYFVRHLHSVEPPKEYEFKTDTSRR